MTAAQTSIAVAELEKRGHQFKLTTDGKIHVTNVTAPVRAFVGRFRDDIVCFLEARNLEVRTRSHFPGATVVERVTWPEMQQRWRAFAEENGLDYFLQMRILSRSLGNMTEPYELDTVNRLLQDTYDRYPHAALDATASPGEPEDRWSKIPF